MWSVNDIFVLPGVITSLCLDTVSARKGVGHSLLPAQTAWNSLSDDLCDLTLMALTVSDVCLKLGCFQSTSTYSTQRYHTLCDI